MKKVICEVIEILSSIRKNTFSFNIRKTRFDEIYGAKRVIKLHIYNYRIGIDCPFANVISLSLPLIKLEFT